ncbi:hypothetical protein Ancab_010798 [Ancistrocladus abbreviatus]
MDKYTLLQGDYNGIMRNPCTLIPPIFLNGDGLCLEWNDSMQKLSGLDREAAVGRILIGEVFTVENFGCRVKDHDTLTSLSILLNRVIAGEDAAKLLFGFFDQCGNYVDALLLANPRTDADGKVTGVICFLHVPSPELRYAMQMQRFSELAAVNSLKKLSYVRMQIKNTLSGMVFTRNLIESSDLNTQQKQLLKTRSLCEEQLAKIVNDTDISSIEERYMELNTRAFNLGKALDAVMSQVMILSQEHQVQVIHDSTSGVSSICLTGDNLRLRQVLVDFMTNAVNFTPVSEGSSVTLTVLPRREHLGMKIEVVHLEFWITHPAPGIPEDLIQEMFHSSPSMSRGGLGLYISHKIVRIMNGTVKNLRGEERSSFIVLREFPLDQ